MIWNSDCIKWYYLLIFSYCCLSACSSSNKATSANNLNKLQVYLQQAIQAQNNSQYGKAKQLYQKVISLDSKNLEAMTRLAGIYSSEHKSDSLILLLQQVVAIDTNPTTQVLYTLANAYYDKAEYAQALPLAEKYMKKDAKNANSEENARKIIRNCKFAIGAIQHPVPYKPIKLPPEINTDEPEYLPSLSADGNLLIYSKITNSQEDLYYSHKTKEGWSVGEPIPMINSVRYNEAAQCISADGKTLIFTGCNIPGGMGNCDLYFSHFANGHWSKPKNMGTSINTQGWESQPSLSADGNTLYFASERPNGYGRKDIWTSDRLGKEQWSKAEPLKAPVNTSSNEASPFIHADNTTLYFMSDGLPGMGGYDLYFSKKNADNTWSVPVNLGYPINTRGDEGALYVNVAGDTAYFTSTGEKKTISSGNVFNTDIYLFEMPESIRPLPATYCQLFIKDEKDDSPIQAEINITGLHTAINYNLQTDGDGSILLPLPANQDYGIQLYAQGYIFISDVFTMPQDNKRLTPYVKTFFLKKIKNHLGENFIMHNVYFESGSARLNPVSLAEIKILAKALQVDPKLKVTIIGYTDDVGSESDNQSLSEQRAAAVVNALVQMGIHSDRLQSKGMGETGNIAPNDTEQGRQQNRRTEFQYRY